MSDYTIEQSEPTAALRAVMIFLTDSLSGDPRPDIVVSVGDVELRKFGGAWGASTGTPVDYGNGSWLIPLSTTEVNTVGILGYRIDKTGDTARYFEDNLLVVPTLKSRVQDAVLTAIVDGTRTIKGVMARMNAAVKGKWTGMIGATAAAYLEDGVTKAMEFTQNTPTGARDAATTVNGD